MQAETTRCRVVDPLGDRHGRSYDEADRCNLVVSRRAFTDHVGAVRQLYNEARTARSGATPDRPPGRREYRLRPRCASTAGESCGWPNLCRSDPTLRRLRMFGVYI